MGTQVKAFEAAMASYLRVKHFVMLNSGSSANLLIFEALLRPAREPSKTKLESGDGVLVPAIAWPTTIWPIVQLGLRPIFVDINPETIALDLTAAQVEIDKNKAIGRKVAAIFPIHPLGYSVSPEELGNFSQKNDLILINDVCESLGSWRSGIHAGTSGLAASFSFYFSHHITTMEGGGIATNSDVFSDDLRAMRSHGWSRDRSDAEEWQAGLDFASSKFQFVTTGYNVRPMEIQAAIGLGQLRDLPKFIEKRRATARKVKEVTKDTILEIIDGGTLSDESKADEHSWMLIALRVKSQNPEESKRKILLKLRELEVETRPVLTGNFLSQPAMALLDGKYPPPDDFPEANKLSNSSFMVGAHHDFTGEQIEHLCKSLRKAAIESE